MEKVKLAKCTFSFEINEIIKNLEQKKCMEWAINCLQHINTNYFNNEYCNECFEVINKNYNLWKNNKITIFEARKIAFKMHEKARVVENDKSLYCFLRACGHTIATIHVKTHAIYSSKYCISALNYLIDDKLSKTEQIWQLNKLKNLV